MTEPRTLWEALIARVEAHPERPALRFAEASFSYATLTDLASRAAAGLYRLGARAETRVAAILPNGPELVACWLGLARLGATLVPLNTKLRGELLGYQLSHAEPDMAIVDERYLSSFEEAVGAAGPRLRVLVGDGPAPPGWLRFEDLLVEAPELDLTGPNLAPEGLALIMYTSGTTGRPKGAMIPRRAQLRHGLNYSGLLGIHEHETAYVYLPLFHVTAMGSTLGSLLAGASVAVDDGFSPFGFWDRCRQHGAVVFTFVGSILSALYHRPLRPDDADNPVRRAIGAATPAWLWREFEHRFGLEIVETYGQTEMAALWLMPPEGAPRVGTVGMPPAGRFEVRIVGPDRLPLGPEQRGEIALRPADPLDMMLGYYRDPEATAAALPGDGWYYTGDLGIMDADGYIRYVGRLRDCIRRRGEMVAAYEIERVVNAHPLVLESAAVGVPSERGEEEVKLSVVPRPNATLAPRAVWEYCRAELPAFMVPRWVQLRPSLPKTATERVRKPDLAAEGVAGCWSAGGPDEA